MTTKKNYYIYELRCKDADVKDFYVGSTTNLSQRLSCHKTCVNNDNNPHYQYKVYKTIRENGGWSNWEGKEVEKLENELQLKIADYNFHITKYNNKTSQFPDFILAWIFRFKRKMQSNGK
jgi:hypothetical protein